MNTSPILGIDLGTTNSLVAYWHDGKAQLIKNALGSVLTPNSRCELAAHGQAYVVIASNH